MNSNSASENNFNLNIDPDIQLQDSELLIRAEEEGGRNDFEVDFNERLNAIESELGTHSDRLDRVDVRLAQLELNLEHEKARMTSLEEQLKSLKSEEWMAASSEAEFDERVTQLREEALASGERIASTSRLLSWLQTLQSLHKYFSRPPPRLRLGTSSRAHQREYISIFISVYVYP